MYNLFTSFNGEIIHLGTYNNPPFRVLNKKMRSIGFLRIGNVTETTAKDGSWITYESKNGADRVMFKVERTTSDLSKRKLDNFVTFISEELD
jgi:hypothetical protein